MKKRKYPISFFILGFLSNFISSFFVLIPIIICFIAGALGVSAAFMLMQTIMVGWVLYAFIMQLYIRHESLKDSDNPEFNELMDEMLGVDDSDDAQNDESTKDKKDLN